MGLDCKQDNMPPTPPSEAKAQKPTPRQNNGPRPLVPLSDGVSGITLKQMGPSPSQGGAQGKQNLHPGLERLPPVPEDTIIPHNSLRWPTRPTNQSFYDRNPSPTPSLNDSITKAMELTVEAKVYRREREELKLEKDSLEANCSSCLDRHGQIQPGLSETYWHNKSQLNVIEGAYHSRDRYGKEVKTAMENLEQGLRFHQQGDFERAETFIKAGLNQYSAQISPRRIIPIQKLSEQGKQTVANLALNPSFQSIDLAHQEALVNTLLFQGLSTEQFQGVISLTSNPSFQGSPLEHQSVLVDGILSQSDKSRCNKLSLLLQQQDFWGLNQTHQQNLVELFQGTESYALDSLSRLLTTKYGRGPEKLPLLLDPDLLTGRDRLLDHLVDLNRQIQNGGLAPGLGIPKLFGGQGIPADTLSHLIIRLDHYGATIQGNRGVCPMGGYYFFLGRKYPGETARIAKELLLANPQPLRRHQPREVMLASGKSLPRSPDSVYGDDSHRTADERIFLASYMDLANGPLKDYFNSMDQHFNHETKQYEGTGLNVYETLIAVAAGQHTPQMVFFNDGTVEAFDKNAHIVARGTLEERLGRDPHIKKEQHPANTLIQGLWQHTNMRDPSNRNPKMAMVGLKWSGQGNKHEYHAVTVESVVYPIAGVPNQDKETRIFFRNPWGPYPKNTPNKHEFKTPPYRVEDASTGYCSMKMDDFVERVQWALITIPENELAQQIELFKIGKAPIMANIGNNNPLR